MKQARTTGFSGNAHRRAAGGATWLLLLCMAAATGAASPGQVDLLAYEHMAEDDDWSEAIAAAIEEAGPDGVIELPRGRYTLRSAIEIDHGLTLRFQRQAELVAASEAEALIRLREGTLILEGVGGHGVVQNENGAVIDLNEVEPDAAASLIVHRMRLAGRHAIDGRRETENKASLHQIQLRDCILEPGETHLVLEHFPTIHRVEIDDTTFQGPVEVGVEISHNVISQGVSVRNSTFVDVRQRALRIRGTEIHGWASMRDVPMVQVHGNHVVGGGDVPWWRQYHGGIWVQAHNVSIQGNIVRDFNRGEPVPDASYGHQVISDEQEEPLRGIFRPGRDGSNDRVRLAGAAIYVKAHHGLVAGNICYNAGWRSVVEVKGGPTDNHVLVTGNVVDGRSLAHDQSFGFEAMSGASVWSNNLIANMPDRAFQIHNRGYRNTYMHNHVYNARRGFHRHWQGDDELPATEWMVGNRFVDVETPYGDLHDVHGREPTRSPGGVLVVADEADLPEAGESHRGQIALVEGDSTDRLLICKQAGGEYAWYPLPAER